MTIRPRLRVHPGPTGASRVAVRLVLALLLALSVACAKSAPNDVAAPEQAFQGVRRALVVEDHVTLWSFLGPETRGALEARAAASEAAGAPVEHPAALLVAAWVPDAADLQGIERVEETDAHVTLRLTSAQGHESEAIMRRSDTGWYVEFEFPAEAGE